jgi:hypothetical protein
MPEPITPSEQTFEELGKRLQAKLVGFDPLTIISIIVAAIEILTSKMENEREATSVQDCCKRRPIRTHVLLQRELARQGVPILQRGRAATALLDIGKEAKQAEVAAFCNCCGPFVNKG